MFIFTYVIGCLCFVFIPKRLNGIQNSDVRFTTFDFRLPTSDFRPPIIIPLCVKKSCHGCFMCFFIRKNIFMTKNCMLRKKMMLAADGISRT